MVKFVIRLAPSQPTHFSHPMTPDNFCMLLCGFEDKYSQVVVLRTTILRPDLSEALLDLTSTQGNISFTQGKLAVHGTSVLRLVGQSLNFVLWPCWMVA